MKIARQEQKGAAGAAVKLVTRKHFIHEATLPWRVQRVRRA